MRYKYKVIDITENENNNNVENMESMSLKKLQKRLDHKKLYKIEYINKKGNHIVAHISGVAPK
tara:strand:+ start:596 stop:784 length:189 start_codon:yes stop_codon:yes gene_type:complete